MIGTLFGCATSTDETGNGPAEETGNGQAEETNTPADYFGIHPDYKEKKDIFYQLRQGDEKYKFVNFYTEEEKDLLNKKFFISSPRYLDNDLKEYIIATSKDGKHKYDPTKIKIKNVKNVTWYNIVEYGFSDVDLMIISKIKEPYEYDGEYYYNFDGYFKNYDYLDLNELNNEENYQYLINNKSFVEDLISKHEDIYKLKYDLKTFKVKEGFQDAYFLDEEKNPYLKWVNVSIPVYYFDYFYYLDYSEYRFWGRHDYTNDKSSGWELYQENGISGDVNKIKEAILAGKYYSVDFLKNAKIENDEIYITSVNLEQLYYLVTLEYENLEYDIIIELWQ